jgi:hypothetical protein
MKDKESPIFLLLMAFNELPTHMFRKIEGVAFYFLFDSHKDYRLSIFLI